MVTEQDKTLTALQLAIKMEIDGKEYYLKASQVSKNELGKKLLESLAAEEDIHRQKFAEIYEAFKSEKAWPKVNFQPDGGKGLRTIFATTSEKMGSNVKAPATELDAVQTAIDMEVKSYDLYKDRSQSAIFETERDFYETLAGEEREHRLVLVDYQQYLKDPAAWFAEKEHHSLDGG